MKKILFNLCLGVMAILLASCGSSGSAVLDGYDFSCDGILGKIPMGQAVRLTTARDICVDIQNDNTQLSGKMTKEDIEKIHNLITKMEERYQHCTDDLLEDLAADSARLLSMKDVAWENKTSSNVKLAKIQLGVKKYSYLQSHDIAFVFEANPEEVKKLPQNILHYAAVDKQGKAISHGSLKEQQTPGSYEMTIMMDHVMLDMEGMLKACNSEDKYKMMMNFCLELDSIDKVLILDDNQILDYRPSFTITGIGPVQLGADLNTLPKSLQDVYNNCYDMQAPDGDKYYAFDSSTGATMFTAIGSPDGKIKCIEVGSYVFPVKFGNVVLRVEDPYCKIVEQYGKSISWSYNPETLSATASFEHGKVTFEVFGDFFTDSGTAKLQQLQNGAKNVVFVPSDFNPDEQLQYYRIQAGK